MARLARIRRHPVKSAGGEDLGAVSLAAGQRLPGDREWAVLTRSGEPMAAARDDGAWLPKTAFMTTAKSHPLQAVQGGWSEGKLALSHPDRDPVTADPWAEPETLVDWLRPLWPDDRGQPTRLLRRAEGFTDQSGPLISVLSLTSLADLEQAMGQTLDIERWRGNLWIDGWPAFAERQLIGQEIHIGSVTLRVTAHIGRCAATSGNAATGTADCDMLASLRRLYDHTDFGVFATVSKGGEIALGDEVQG